MTCDKIPCSCRGDLPAQPLRQRLRRAGGENADLLAIAVMLLIAGWTMVEIWRLA